MGCDMYFHDSDCRITIAEQGNFFEKEGKTLSQYCKDHGWGITVNKTGEVTGLQTEDIRFSAAEDFFKGLAPYLNGKSKFSYEDEEKNQGSFIIENRELRHNQLDVWYVNWEEPPTELLRKLIRAHIEHADADAVRTLVDEEIASAVMEV